MNGTGHLVPDIIKDLLAKMINATSMNERHNYELQVKAISAACTAALNRAATTPIKSRKRA
jgi:hypothetical protein